MFPRKHQIFGLIYWRNLKPGNLFSVSSLQLHSISITKEILATSSGTMPTNEWNVAGYPKSRGMGKTQVGALRTLDFSAFEVILNMSNW